MRHNDKERSTSAAPYPYGTWQQVHVFRDTFGLPRNWGPTYNLAPDTEADVVDRVGRREPWVMPWRLASFWKDGLKEAPVTVKRGPKTVANKPMCSKALRLRLCIIPASGYFEWTCKRAINNRLNQRLAARRSSLSQALGSRENPAAR